MVSKEFLLKCGQTVETLSSSKRVAVVGDLLASSVIEDIFHISYIVISAIVIKTKVPISLFCVCGFGVVWTVVRCSIICEPNIETTVD